MAVLSIFSGNGNLTSVVSLVLILLGIGIWRLLFMSKRFPNAPWLRVSKKPGILGTWEDRAAFDKNSIDFLRIGWERYSKHGINYMLDTAEGPRYIVAQKYFDEVVRAPDSHVSALAAANEVMQIDYTLHKILGEDQFHFDLPIKKSLTQALGPKLGDIVEEGKLAIDEFIGDAKVPTARNGLAISFDIVTRTANRLLFNIALTRNKEFHKMSIDYTFVMFGGAYKVRSLPNFLKPLVMWWSTGLYKIQDVARGLVMPMLQERVREEKAARANGTAKTRKKDDDMVQWILDYASDEELNPDRLFYRMLHINVAAVHTSSTTFADVLYAVTLFPQYQDELRDEIIRIFRQENGWSKQTLTFLAKMDSFMTECGRLQPNSSLKNARIITQDWQFKDGTKLPKGTHLFTNQTAYQMQDSTFDDPDTFNPWRMSNLRSKPGEELKHQYVMTSDKNLHFGHGKHACPGRFFAANEVKILLALILMRFDLRIKETNWSEVRHGMRNAVQRGPVDHAIIEFTDRSSQIPEDLQPYFV